MRTRQEETTMKLFTTNLMLAAAVMAIAGSASAQALSAEVPFAFHVRDTVMAPGSYRVETAWSSGAPLVRVNNIGQKQTAMIVGHAESVVQNRKGDDHARLVFKCNGSRCELASVSSGSGAVPVMVPTTKAVRSERAEVRIVPLNYIAD
jgi:hypothetical protein